MIRNCFSCKSLFRSLLQQVYIFTGLRFSISTVSLSSYSVLKKQLKEFNRQGKESPVSFPVSKLYPVYEDRYAGAGRLEFHYFYQDLHVAQRIYKNNPVRHIDIGSRINGVVACVASFREIEVYDIRPLKMPIPNVSFKQFDLMQLNEEDAESVDSISSLHVLEHFGLGRYGDPVCYDGYLLGFMNIHRMLKKRGKFYFSVPMGKQRVEFHAHRVFSLKYQSKQTHSGGIRSVLVTSR